MLRLVLTQKKTNRLVIKHLQPCQDFLIKFNISLNKIRKMGGMFCVWTKSSAYFWAMIPVSFFWPPVFRSFIGSGIRNFTTSFLVYFHPPIVLSTNLMNPLTNLTSLLSEVSNSCQTTPTNSSQKIQIKRQKKQCFNCPTISLKALVTKTKTKKSI